MIAFEKKRIFGLIGAPRSGKDTVANYLTETRGFATLAFADQIKEEFGISKEEFEAAKIAGNIEELRQRLWDFSAKIKAKDPMHFINSVMEKATKHSAPVIITDIRTEDELLAFYTSFKREELRRIYFIIRGESDNKSGILAGSKLSISLINKYLTSPERQMQIINNTANGVYQFYQDLDKFFVIEDVKDLLHDGKEQDMVVKYLIQYDVLQARKV